MDSLQIPWLTTAIAFPLLAALVIPLIPDKEGKTIRWYTLGVALTDFALLVTAFWQNYDLGRTEFQLTENFAWIPQLGLNWSLGVDGLSMPLIILATLITTLATLAAWNVTKKPKLFAGLILVMLSAQIGVFAVQDLLLFFIMWELELVPVYLLISIWGGKKRLYAATKFILYTALGSVFILASTLALAFYGGDVTFDMQALGLKDYPLALELLAYAGFLIGFGVKLPIFPLHTWLPDAHSEASAPVSMILAGVLLKMGGYGLIRLNMEMLPDAHIRFAPLLIVLGIVNIVYGALTAFGQTNLKRRLASSSISHMGFVLVGIASFTDLGMNGAVLQMLSHGFIAAALFFLSGVTYERTHTLMMDEMSGIARLMPKTFAMFTAAAMASLALPGMSGFVSELTVFLGLSNSDAYSYGFKAIAIFLTAVGVILTPIYLLSMLREVFYGKGSQAPLSLAAGEDAKPREIFVAVCLLAPIIAIGLYPKLATTTYDLKTVEVASKVRAALPLYAEQLPQNGDRQAQMGLSSQMPALIAPRF
ncbi:MULTISPECIES: NAD(P)H-quinone oxidoreductase subunit 4 [Cyanophyceae]|uniref:NAD(P)H-quinone oxidoreductase chain 4 1 n=1 Tax=Picosynechococcus sp. (strain ATCC 27264 / PCC 7002 / PR-6) TaxID=32049 RepID=NU4C1_PICP2|nr:MULTISPECIES: NAD(P)H-quinone oxidoreductase subunit 4 [Cyanophyceae]B1XHP2.1 RecName: Full=NAD(P)H-quinone oxidoreductase chain 4 1; AltName: Full=NAD(P)H dehydrogenase I, chain 4 1; AltName: Full=NDH-1, chain 4 1 [Picosynechococcus sp. PCC 7002]ACA99960.1 NADH dehydrogenase subunit D2 [Picosynechococcus sp. PCC 7002]QCS50478.1 NAD(P)H-quinone oxidoreductase chain 4 1 [Picosynechococcus sp. PCC 11901]SMH54434.1 NADH dehydrogenase subunit M [Picosynechococcus sp. OG1]SMQ82973.1 NADH dehydro